MLTPAHVLPFLNHDDSWVRDHAIDYFRGCPDPAPLTADHLWAVLDARGETLETLPFAQALAAAPDTEPSLDRLLKALDVDREDAFEIHYQRAARDVDSPLLLAHRDRLLAHPRLVPHVRDHLLLRLALADQPVETLWNRLMDHGHALGQIHEHGFNPSESDALIEALARHPSVIGPRALAALAVPSLEESWQDVFAVRVLGHARFAPAIPALVQQLVIDEDDLTDELLPSEAADALARINTPEVVESLKAFYPTQGWEARLYADIPLARIKRPESEAVLLELLNIEDDDALQISLLTDLLDLGSLRGLDRSRQIIAAGPKDPDLIDFTAALLATAVMQGMDLPEAAKWRARIKADYDESLKSPDALDAFALERENRWRATAILDPESDDDLSLNQDALDDDWAAADGFDDEGEFDDADPFVDAGPESLPRPDAIEPYRRETPKVGRNDPCPCGSGKKYKKCCMDK